MKYAHIITFLTLCFFAASSTVSAQTLPAKTDTLYTVDWDTLGSPKHIEPMQWVNEEKTDTVQTQLFQTGKATYYSSRMHGRMMASGERYDRNGFFAAHRTLPFGTMVRVVNKKNGKETFVRIADRGPFGKGLVIDLSNSAASAIGMIADGVVPVELYIVEENE